MYLTYHIQNNLELQNKIVFNLNNTKNGYNVSKYETDKTLTYNEVKDLIDFNSSKIYKVQKK